MSFLPPADINAVSSLLEILKDPKAAQERLDALKAVNDSAAQSLDEIREKTRLLEDMGVQVEAQKKAYEDNLQKWTETSSAEQKRLEDWVAKLSAQASDLRAKQDLVDRLQTEVSGKISARESAVEKRENTVTVRENNVLHEQEAAESLRKEYESKLEKLNELVKG